MTRSYEIVVIKRLNLLAQNDNRKTINDTGIVTVQR